MPKIETLVDEGFRVSLIEIAFVIPNFREGLIAMLDELEPRVVLVYGAMPDTIFHGLETRTEFVQYPDWTRRMKQK